MRCEITISLLDERAEILYSCCRVPCTKYVGDLVTMLGEMSFSFGGGGGAGWCVGSRGLWVEVMNISVSGDRLF